MRNLPKAKIPASTNMSKPKYTHNQYLQRVNHFCWNHTAHTLRSVLADIILRRNHIIFPLFNMSIKDTLRDNIPNYKGTSHYAQSIARRCWGGYIDRHILAYVLDFKIDLYIIRPPRFHFFEQVGKESCTRSVSILYCNNVHYDLICKSNS